MAKKKTSENGKTPSDDHSETAPDAAETVTENTEEQASEPEATSDEAAVADKTPEPESDESVESDNDSEPATSEIETSEDDTLEDAAAPDGEVDTQKELPAPVEQVVVKKGGAVPLVLGGVAAGAIGFAAAVFGFDVLNNGRDQQNTQIAAALERQTDEISAMQTRLDALPVMPDLAPVEDGLSDAEAAIESLADRLAGLETVLADLETRLTDVEKQPITGGADEAAVAAYERELDALRESMAQQRSEIEAMIANAQNVEDTAEEAASAAMRRAAVTRILTALETGTGFAGALGDLEQSGVTVPEALAQVAGSGVASISALQDSFPEAARAALAASRRVAAETGESSGFTAFLRNQLGARSLEPREGNDPDAVLSRAEAATREGRLTDALAEIEALPEQGRAALSDWSERAARRLDAVWAAQELSETLN